MFKNIVSIFLILCIVYYLSTSIKENFVTSIVAYNNTSTPDYYIPSLFEAETKELTKIFKILSVDTNFKTDKYNIQNPYLPFPFNNHLKRFIILYLKDKSERFKNNKIEIITDLNDIYWKDVDNDRIFIFNFDLLDNTQFMTRNIQMKIKIKDIAKFLKTKDDYSIEPEEIKEPLTNYKTDVPVATFLTSVQVLGIQLGKNNLIQLNVNGMGELDSKYYEIKNVLGLLDPFLTSGKSMEITDRMKTKFEKNIKEDQELLNVLSGKKI